MAQSDPYIVLGVDRSMTLEQIQTAYRKKCLETHPDRNRTDPHALRRFQAVAAAWQAIEEERTGRKRATYEPPPPPSAAPAPPAPTRLAQQVVATAAVAAETAVEGIADRLAARGGWAAVLGETLRGAAKGMSEAAQTVRTDEKTRQRPG